MTDNIFPSPYTLSLPEGNWNINGEKSKDPEGADQYIYQAGPLERVFSEPGSYSYTEETEGITQFVHVTPGEEFVIISKTEITENGSTTISIIYDGPHNGSRYLFEYVILNPVE